MDQVPVRVCKVWRRQVVSSSSSIDREWMMVVTQKPRVASRFSPLPKKQPHLRSSLCDGGVKIMALGLAGLVGDRKLRPFCIATCTMRTPLFFMTPH